MAVVTRFQRVYFAAVGALALYVGIWGYFIPAHVDGAIPWLVPPLHARFLGTMYLSGATFMLGCIFARRYAEVRVVVPMIAIWTGMLFVVSLFYLNEFDFSRDQTWIWFGAYIVYPLIAIWLIWKDYPRAHEDTMPGPTLPYWVRGYLLGQGVAATILGLALLLVPDLMVAAWPWKITRLLTQIYSAPLLSYGIGGLLLARQHTWAEIRVATTATLVFTAGVLLASVIHRSLFAASLATWLWFGGFTIATLILGLLTRHAWQPQRHQEALAQA
jgi:hypothetical protein